jgi:hypothetical protein
MRGTVKVKVNLFSRTHLQLNARPESSWGPRPWHGAFIYQARCQRSWIGALSCLSLSNFCLLSCRDTLFIMSDKLSADLDNDVHHNEKHQVQEKHEVDLSETAGRRASVALNIVENPLQVGLIPCGLARLTPQPLCSKTPTNACLLYSANLPSKSLPMPANSQKRTAWPSMQSSLPMPHLLLAISHVSKSLEVFLSLSVLP